MRRGAKLTKPRVTKPPVSRKSRKNQDSKVRDLEKRLAGAQKREAEALKREAEAQEQQTATAEILGVISRSPTDVQPVFDTIVRSAVVLCGAMYGTAVRFDGELMHLVAGYNYTPEVARLLHEAFPMRPSPRMMAGRAILSRDVVQVEDALEDSDYAEGVARAGGFRSMLAAPMLRDGRPIGAIVVNRGQPGSFSRSQIELLKTFADQAVIAIENVRLFTELQEKNTALTQAHTQVAEALEQQTATGEILAVISASPTDLQPVLDALVKNAVRFCGSYDASIFQRDGDYLRGDAHHGPVPQTDRLLVRGSVAGRTVLERRTIHVADLQAETKEFPVATENSRRLGFRTILSVPLMREGIAIGAIQLRRTEAHLFSDKQVRLLETFADQAVIAIENVRLFKQLEARNRDLSEALEQQTATSEILGVISRSPTEVEPVFAAVVASAARLCEAHDVAMLLVDGDEVRSVAGVGPLYMSIPSDLRISLTRGSAATRAVVDRTTVHIHDFAAESEDEYPVGRELARRFGHRSMLAVPLLREGVPIGVICAFRLEVRPFPDQQIALLRTFADQAVIAIENVRLFTELQERNRAVTQAHAQVSEALEQQTATSEILRVISGSPTDVQPVFDTIVRNAVRLCEGQYSGAARFDGELMHLTAHHNYTPDVLQLLRQMYPMRPDRQQVLGRAILTRAVAHVEDALADPEYPHHVARAGGWRGMLAVPMLREGTAIGAIFVTRARPGPFSPTQVELLKTFAEQAVIAIENVRLFRELEARTGELTQSVEKLTALGEVSQVLSSTLDLDTVLTTIVTRAVHLSGADGGQIFEYDEVAEEFQPRASNEVEDVVAATQHTRLRKGEGAVGRMAVTREAIQIPDIAIEGAYESRARGALLRSGRHALLAVPLLSEEHIVGGLVISRNAAGAFPVEVVELLKTFATQSALAIQNARLFREIADKSRQLEAASRHKSEFLANMSHELRTPLNAVIGFSEVLLQRMFGELNAKQDEYLKDIYASGQHLLSLINDILDLSKIEAGRMELAPTPFHLPTALENAITLVKERAGRHGIALHLDLDPRLGELVGDERKVKQVLLNLLSNAVKFTPEGGRISLKARSTDGAVEIAVTDTGIGIAPEDQAAIFEEFRQVGTDETRRQEGTGLGLTLAKKFIELHGGRIWVESEVGQGSTFTFTLPVS